MNLKFFLSIYINLINLIQSNKNQCFLAKIIIIIISSQIIIKLIVKNLIRV